MNDPLICQLHSGIIYIENTGDFPVLYAAKVVPTQLLLHVVDYSWHRFKAKFVRYFIFKHYLYDFDFQAS